MKLIIVSLIIALLSFSHPVDFKSVKIGSQEWSLQNLDTDHYRNGDVIPQVQDAEEWSRLTTGAWRYYQDIPELGNKYGKLYN
jgi:hypothetical protein